jgi:adenylate cyclase
MGEPEEPLDIAEAAAVCGTSPSTIARLIELHLLPEDGPRRADINGIRLMTSFESAGIGLDVFADAARSGFLSLEFRRNLLPDQIGLSDRTFAEACEELGIEEPVAARMAMSAGLALPEPDQPIREDDLTLLRQIADSLALGVSEESATRVLTVFGRSARLQAEAMRDLFRRDVEAATAERGLSPGDVMEVAAQRRPPLQRIGFSLLELLARRSLEDVVFENVTMRIQDALSGSGRAPARRIPDVTVAFMDISGFSRMTREIGDDEAAARAARFDAIAHGETGRRSGRIVKTMGDGLLATFDSPGDATIACLEIMQLLEAASLPKIHVGMDVGPLVRRDGDVFGNTVNLAARLAGFASPSEIVIPMASLPDDVRSTYPWSDGGRVEPRGLDPIRIARLAASEATRRRRAGRDEGLPIN